MTDLFLRFEGQPEALSVMADFTYTDDDGIHFSQGSHQYALWEVGEINGVDGWHVNLRIIDDTLDVSALEPYCVTPRNPVCVWG
jgi:hypothetical protein